MHQEIARPAQAASHFIKSIALAAVFMTAQAGAQTCDPQLIEQLTPPDGGLEMGQSTDTDGVRMIVGAPGQRASASVFKRDGRTWVSEAALREEHPQLGDRFGQSVAIRGDTIIVGAPYHSADSLIAAGAAYVFTFDGHNWNQAQELLPTVPRAHAQFGSAVAFGHGFLVIGATGDSEFGTDAGTAYIFRDTPHGWIEETKLVPHGTQPGDHVGRDVDASGNAVIVSAHGADDNGRNSGSASIFRYDNQRWSEEARLVAHFGEEGDAFGYSVAILNSLAVVSSLYDDTFGTDSGSANIFQRINGEWSEGLQKLHSFLGGDGIRFGCSVDIAEPNTILVGADLADVLGEPIGAAYVFRNANKNGWDTGYWLMNPRFQPLDRFGSAVAGHGDTVGIGAYAADHSHGAAFVYDLNCANGQYLLLVHGACPGEVTIEWSGADPHAAQALVFGEFDGTTIIPPAAPCAGTVLYVQGHARLINPPGHFSTGEGSGRLTGQAGRGACGGFLQLIERSDCRTSNPTRLP